MFSLTTARAILVYVGRHLALCTELLQNYYYIRNIVLPIRKPLYLEWFQNHRKQIVHYRCVAIRSLTSPCNRCPNFMFRLQFAQYGLLHSCFLFVSNLPHAAQFCFCSPTVFPRNLLLLCLSKHTRLLKVLLHDSHGIRTFENVHVGTDIQSLRLFAFMCHVHIASFITRFAHTFSHRTCNTYHHMVMTCDVVKGS